MEYSLTPAFKHRDVRNVRILVRETSFWLGPQRRKPVWACISGQRTRPTDHIKAPLYADRVSSSTGFALDRSIRRLMASLRG